MYSANDIAKYVIKRCSDRENPISNLQLQKILYYIQGYFLAIFNTAAFEDDIYAWRYGPVIPDIYYDYNCFGAEPISLDGGETTNLEKLTHIQRKVIDLVIDSKSLLSAWQLVDETHNETPWKDAEQSNIISKESIGEYFRTIM